MYKHLTIAAAIFINQIAAIKPVNSGAEPASVADMDSFIDEHDLAGKSESHDSHHELFAELEKEMVALSARLGYEHPKDLHTMSADERAAAMDKMGEFMSHPDHQEAIDEHINSLMENPKFKELFAGFGAHEEF